MTTRQIEALDSVAALITDLRAATRQALIDDDQNRTREILCQLKSAETAWHTLIGADPIEITDPTETAGTSADGFALPAREQIMRTLSLIGVPARPVLISHVHNALFPGRLTSSSFTSIRRDEEKAWHRHTGARRPSYIVPALALDDLTPVRALLALSSWPAERRIVGPHSDQTDYHATAVAVASAVMSMEAAQRDPEHRAWSLLEQVASGLDVRERKGKRLDPADVISAVERAGREAAETIQQDQADRRRSAYLLSQLSPAEQLFGRSEV